MAHDAQDGQVQRLGGVLEEHDALRVGQAEQFADGLTSIEDHPSGLDGLAMPAASGAAPMVSR